MLPPSNPDALQAGADILPSIGTDESGKGDFFGPLVCAGVYVDAASAEVLRGSGVRDSKRLSDPRCRELAEVIKGTCRGQYIILGIGPARYNDLYERFRREGKTLNTLLAWAHARVLENLLGRVECAHAITDQFADPRFVQSKLQERGKKIHLLQMPRAETHIAVAAASILARARFLEQLERLSAQFGLPLPKGASQAVIQAGQAFVKRFGKAALRQVAKLHFRTTVQVLASA
ncbi:MAG: ribonuclease HIII [Nitrospinae bacterium]|nr:ribonuclease HIII [Nitrospinota bacterium]